MKEQFYNVQLSHDEIFTLVALITIFGENSKGNMNVKGKKICFRDLKSKLSNAVHNSSDK